MSKPLIGIAPDFTPAVGGKRGASDATIFLRNRYVTAVEAAGGLPMILPVTTNPELCRTLVKSLDGLLLTGSGPDIDPRRYGERKRFNFKIMSSERTDSECVLVREARKRDVPVLGICGGMQLMNVALGGSLVQDIDRELDEPLPHRMTRPATEVCHRVRVKPGTRLSSIVRRREIDVNSSHHQAVKRVPRSLKVSASASDGVIEAVEDPTRRFFIGVQWHPEYLYRQFPRHRALFKALISAARSKPPRSIRQTRKRT